jgi:hypothetical protein
VTRDRRLLLGLVSVAAIALLAYANRGYFGVRGQYRELLFHNGQFARAAQFDTTLQLLQGDSTAARASLRRAADAAPDDRRVPTVAGLRSLLDGGREAAIPLW